MTSRLGDRLGSAGTGQPDTLIVLSTIQVSATLMLSDEDHQAIGSANLE